MSGVKIDPRKVRFKISPHNDLHGVEGGDWDLDRRVALERAVKHRGIRQRYVEGLPWEATDLFTQVYRPRLKREPVRGEQSLEGLLAQYYSRVDAMFEDLKRHGFRENYPLPRLLIGRAGEVFIGNQGNHRLAMAQIIGLKEIQGEVICWHKCLRDSAALTRA